jgi:hypothetical protein
MEHDVNDDELTIFVVGGVVAALTYDYKSWALVSRGAGWVAETLIPSTAYFVPEDAGRCWRRVPSDALPVSCHLRNLARTLALLLNGLLELPFPSIRPMRLYPFSIPPSPISVSLITRTTTIDNSTVGGYRQRVSKRSGQHQWPFYQQSLIRLSGAQQQH